jgi:hypothetical protein
MVFPTWIRLECSHVLHPVIPPRLLFPAPHVETIDVLPSASTAARLAAIALDFPLPASHTRNVLGFLRRLHH